MVNNPSSATVNDPALIRLLPVAQLAGASGFPGVASELAEEQLVRFLSQKRQLQRCAMCTEVMPWGQAVGGLRMT